MQSPFCKLGCYKLLPHSQGSRLGCAWRTLLLLLWSFACTAPGAYQMAAPSPPCHGYNTCFAYAKRRWLACSACGADDHKNAVTPEGDYSCGRCWPLHVKNHCLCAEALRLMRGGDTNANASGRDSSGSGSAGGGSGCLFTATAPLQPAGIVPWQQDLGPPAGGKGGTVGAEGTGGGKGVVIASSVGTEGGKARNGKKGGFGNDTDVGRGGQGNSYYEGKGQQGGGRTSDSAMPVELLQRRVQLLEDRLRLLELRLGFPN